MKWIGKRISFVDDKLKTTIVIRPVDNSLVKGLMGAWVGMWMAIGFVVGWSFFTMKLTEQEQIIIAVFASFWLYYAVKVTRSWLWLLWGKELIKINETSLVYKKSIKKFGKATPFFLENISKIRVNTPKERSLQAAWDKSPWVKGGEILEFDYMGKVIRFGRKIDEKDAKLLFNLISKRIEERLRKTKN
jgi:hypothetical protein